MPLALKIGVTHRDSTLVHARLPGRCVAACDSHLTLGEVGNSLFDPEGSDSCRRCAHYVTKGDPDESYFEWLQAKLGSKLERQAFAAVFHTLVDDVGRSPEEVAFHAAQNLGEIRRNAEKERLAAQKRAKKARLERWRAMAKESERKPRR